jgi:hypothetical protein
MAVLCDLYVLLLIRPLSVCFADVSSLPHTPPAEVYGRSRDPGSEGALYEVIIAIQPLGSPVTTARLMDCSLSVT